MFSKLRRRLSYANVASTLALIAAIGGGATAVAVKKKASKGAPVRVTKASDVSKKGFVRPGRVSREKIGDLSIGARQLGELRRYQQGGAGTVSCPPGERLISGGAGGGPITNSYPDLAGEGWTGSGGANIVVFAICLAP